MSEQINTDSILNLKRGIEQEINRIDRKIAYIAKLKDEAVANLLQQKDECTEKEIMGEIDLELEKIKKQHEAVIARQKTIHEAKKEYMDTASALEEIDKELEVIQERHDEVMQQLTDKRDFLKDRLGSIETLDTMKVKIEEEMEQEQDTYEDAVGRLSKAREELLQRTDLSASEMADALREIDASLEQLESDHVRSVNKLSEAAGEVQAELSKNFSTDRKDEILEELKKLRAQALSATPSELAIIEARIEELNKELEHMETMLSIQQGSVEERLTEALEERGIKMTGSGRLLTASGQIKSIEEAREAGLLDGIEMDIDAVQERAKFLELLEERGMKMTPSGRIQTEDGEVYSMEEARKMGLLHGLEEELMKMRGISLTASGRILTKDGKVLTRDEAETLGLLDGINLDDLFAAESESETMTESMGSSMSGLSSSDVHYLKTVLGRPLTLALAEITAKQPRDPIHYLGHWMYKYRYNQAIDELKKKQMDEMMEERDRLAKEMLRKEAETEAKIILMEILGRIDTNDDEQEGVTNELKQIQDAIATSDDDDEAELESEARDTLGVYDGPTRGQQLI